MNTSPPLLQRERCCPLLQAAAAPALIMLAAVTSGEEARQREGEELRRVLEREREMGLAPQGAAAVLEAAAAWGDADEEGEGRLLP